MKKKILKIGSYLGIVLLSLIIMPKVNAATSINVYANKTSVVVGNTVTVTVTYSSSNLLAQVYGTFTYNSSVFQYVSGSDVSISEPNIAGTGARSKVFTYTLKAISSGTSNFGVSNPSAYLLDSDSLEPVTPGVDGSTTKVITQSQLQANYSSNNLLASLSVEGYEISPAFNKDTLEYSVEIPNGITNIKINASKEDSRATISGDGDITVNEGTNKIEVIVTAENGNEKKYIISAVVKELNPVTVKINKKEYTIVRKEGIMDSPSASYTKGTTTISGEEVLSYYSDITKYTLIGLKDGEGNTNYYVYDSKKNKYTLYKEYSFNGIILNIMDMNEDILPNNYKETTVTIDKDKLKGYKIDTNTGKTTYAKQDTKSGEFYLFYALNVNTGKKDLYVYDSNENTVQRYNSKEINYYKEKADTYYIYILILLGIISLAIITCSIILIKKRKKKHKKNRL